MSPELVAGLGKAALELLPAAASPSANYAMAIVGAGSSASVRLAKDYTRLCAREFRHRDAGVLVGHTGWGNVAHREKPDPGAPVYVPPGDPRDGFLWEADIADAVVTAATEMLVAIPAN